MKYSEKKFRLTGITPLLGSVPLDKEVYTKYIAAKAKTAEEKVNAAKGEDEVVCSDETVEEKVTGFYRDTATGGIMLRDYHIKGFLKSAAKTLKDQLGLTNYLSKVDNFIFIKERELFLYNQETNERIMDPDGFLERPLRGQTAQGERVALAKSEVVNAPWYIDVTVKVLDNKGTAKSIGLTMDVVEELLSYGELKGLLQWRNAGYGSFSTNAW